MINYRSCVYLPLIASIVFGMGIWICYGIAAASNHVALVPEWTFISHAGIFPPESCIFTLVCSWGSTAFLMISLGFYSFVREKSRKTKLNKVTLAFGAVAAAGVSIIGSFQTNNVPYAHLVGAALAFVGGAIYCWLIVAISWKYEILFGYSKHIIRFRIFLAVMETVLVIFFGCFRLTTRLTGQYHNVSASLEWLVVFVQLIFYSTVAYEFNKIKRFEVTAQYVE